MSHVLQIPAWGGGGGGRKDVLWIVPSISHCMHRVEFILHKEMGNCSFKKKNSYIANTDLYTYTHTYILLANKERSDL